MLVLKSTLDSVKRALAVKEEEAKVRAEEHRKLKAAHAKLEHDFRVLKLSLPVRDAQGRFSTH